MRELIKEWVDWVEDRPFNDFRYALSPSKLESLGWRQTVSWQDGLKRTKEWYHQLISNNNPTSYWSEFYSALQPHPQIHNLRIESSL
jgi:dTDP-D-glucose 4,6-dehydratase